MPLGSKREARRPATSTHGAYSLYLAVVAKYVKVLLAPGRKAKVPALALEPPGDKNMAERSIWADRFLAACLIEGAVAFAGMGYLLFLSVATTPGPARVVAGGGGGTWFTVGLIGFALICVLGCGLSALFYHYIEVTKGLPYSGWRNLFAWGHLIAGVGVSSAGSLLAAWGGLNAGIAALPVSSGGGGRDFAYVHVNILGPLVLPLAIIMGIGLAGFLAGGVAYFTAWWGAVKKEGGLLRKRAAPKADDKPSD